MPSRHPWRKLLPGIAALALTIGVAVAIVMFAGVGTVHGRTMRLYAIADQARGVMHGTEVWLSGQKVGVVEDVDFLQPSEDTTAHIVMSLTVRASDAHGIRRDSRADVRAGATLLAPIVIYIEPGSPTSARVQAGDTLRASPQKDVQLAMARFSDATAELRPLMADAKAVVSQLRDPSGTIGAFMTAGLPRPVHELTARLVRIRHRNGTGVAARNFMARARTALARSDSIRTLLGSPASSFGRFRRDSALASAVDDIRSELTALEAQMHDADGTIGRASDDDALARSVANAKREMAALFADIRRRPSRYINF